METTEKAVGDSSAGGTDSNKELDVGSDVAGNMWKTLFFIEEHSIIHDFPSCHIISYFQNYIVLFAFWGPVKGPIFTPRFLRGRTNYRQEQGKQNLEKRLWNLTYYEIRNLRRLPKSADTRKSPLTSCL